MVKQSTSLIFQEMSESQELLQNWFDLKDKKFLHQIDTFYYSIKLSNDFTAESKDQSCLKLRKFFQKEMADPSYDKTIPFYLPNHDVQLNIIPWKHFEMFYNICLECPEMFDIFIADKVPVANNCTTGVSVTTEIIVQIRSSMLWQYGPVKAFEKSFEAAKAVCDHFSLTIAEVKENRCDYCWHSNYLQNPEKFFNIEHFAKMQVSRFKRATFQYEFKTGDEYENDYICMGERGNKCFVRIYLKSKEVVEQGYKGWFLKEWLLNGLINRYDFYVYEKCYKMSNWHYLDKARLEFYLEYGADENRKKDIRAIVDGVVTPSPESIHKLADSLTPRVTLITNVEYQTTRKQSKTYVLKQHRNNEDKGICRRIHDYFDNHELITEYLTKDIFRLVDRKTDSNKSRCDYCAFWKALRSTKLVDVKKTPAELKLTRDYSRKLNSEVVRKRALSAAVSFSLYVNGINENDGYIDAAELLCTLNDNDIEAMKKMKYKRAKQLNTLLYSEEIEHTRERTFTIIKEETGEIL